MKDDVNVFDAEVNKEISVRNKIAREISAGYNLPFVDHFDFVVQNKNLFAYRDNFHFFNYEANISLAGLILNILVEKKILTLTNNNDK